MTVLLRAVLVFEALVVALAVPVAVNVAGEGQPAVPVSLLAAALCLVGVVALRWPWGVWVGWAAQAAILAIAVVLPPMVVLGAVFVALWAWSVVLGRRIDAARRGPTDGPAHSRETPPPA